MWDSLFILILIKFNLKTDIWVNQKILSMEQLQNINLLSAKNFKDLKNKYFQWILICFMNYVLYDVL